MIAILCGDAIQSPHLAATRTPEFLHLLPAIYFALPPWFSWNPLVSYVAAVLLLIIGVSIVIRKAPARANWVDRIVLCGPVFIAVPMVLFGLDHYLFPVEIGQFIPSWIPAHMFWVYFVGTCLILGGLSIVFQKYAWLSAGLFGLMLLCFEALMNIPGLFEAPHERITWTLMAREFSFSMGALSFAAMHTREWKTKGTHWLISIARVVLGIALLFFGVEYCLHPELLPGVPLEQLTPNFIPVPVLWGYLNSVVYLIAGICLISNRKSRFAATGAGLFVLFAVIFLCVPFMLQYPSDIGKGLNVPADTLMLSGGLLCLAGSLREESLIKPSETT